MFAITANMYVRGNFHWIKISPSPANFVLQKIWWKTLHRCGKGLHILHIIRTKKISMIKFLPMKAGGKIGKNFYMYGTSRVHQQEVALPPGPSQHF